MKIAFSTLLTAQNKFYIDDTNKLTAKNILLGLLQDSSVINNFFNTPAVKDFDTLVAKLLSAGIINTNQFVERYNNLLDDLVSTFIDFIAQSPNIEIIIF